MEQAIREAGKRDYMRRPQEWTWNVNGLECWISSKDVVHICVIDDNDLRLVSKYRWYVKNGYAVTSIAGRRVKMHHLIAGKPP